MRTVSMRLNTLQLWTKLLFSLAEWNILFVFVLLDLEHVQLQDIAPDMSFKHDIAEAGHCASKVPVNEFFDVGAR